MCRMVSFEGDKKVAEIKLRHIQNIAEQASTANNINRIVLFGSATEEQMFVMGILFHVFLLISSSQ